MPPWGHIIILRDRVPKRGGAQPRRNQDGGEARDCAELRLPTQPRHRAAQLVGQTNWGQEETSSRFLFHGPNTEYLINQKAINQ